MTEAGRQVVEVVIPALMPACVVWIDPGQRIEEGEERGRSGEMRRPIPGCAADAISGVERSGGGTGIRRFQGVDFRGLDLEGEVR